MLKLVKDIRQRYRWGLSAIAILITISAALMQTLFYVQKGDAKVINIAGKQRMLSQKIALHGNALIYQDSERLKEQHRRLLQQAVEQFVSGHQFLLEQDNGEFIHLNSALEAHYFSPPNQLDAHVKRYISQAQQLLNSRTNSSNIDSSIFVSEQLEALLTKLDQAVKLLEQESVYKVTIISVLEVVFWLAAIVLLIIELIFIFKPMEKLIANTIQKYQQQKEYAERVNKNKERFIARTSHEFRTPLQGLTSSIEALDISDNQQLTKQQAIYCVNRLVAMLDELLDLQQLSSGDWQLKPHSSNLLTTLNQAIAPYKYACNDKNITLSVNMSEALDKDVVTDHARLQQVLSELINNAVKFTPKQGRIAVNAICKGHKQVILEVQDNGTGFEHPPAELLDFEHDSEQHFQGLKTGLLRVMHIVKALNGKIEFQNVQPHGVKVVIHLDLENAPKSEMPMQLPTNLHCLIVEDNPLNATILGRIISQFDFSYDIASNGLIATSMTAEKKYDVIFMDLNMPVMDGFKATDIIRNEQSLLTPILAVTANTSNEDLQRIYDLGADMHVYKPISVESVQKALGALFTEGKQG
ncbi:response regulator [Pseudoalteromonas lipolytica]|uniref:histidine kinase n=1 Tax=Pseudoalteromonas lipolytica TaxID=570156 RepID=A0ABY1GXI1_9GAMM|nr:response regulator [Pseudoalteromonas lipolytica]MBE0352192.1 hypothetical protein [Pseudoalteromonas lipolytica LMEB 39]SFT95158.1 Signal transduction histidine kinase [Pseudoalteromonas lipolytica]